MINWIKSLLSKDDKPLISEEGWKKISRLRLAEKLEVGAVDIRTITDDDLLYMRLISNNNVSPKVFAASIREVARRRKERNAGYYASRLLDECLSKADKNSAPGICVNEKNRRRR